MRIILLFTALFFLSQPASAKSPEQDLAFILDVLGKDYAGWEAKTEGDKRAAFEAEVALTRQRIAEKPEARMWAFGNLIDWFGDEHLTVRSNIVSPENPWPSDDEPERVMRPAPGSDFAFTRLSDETVMIRVPTFNPALMAEFEALLEAHHDAITSTPNLVIDLRANSGGSDAMWERLMSYLYTRPIYSIGVEIRASDRNFAYLNGLLEQSGGDGDIAEIVRGVMQRAQQTENEWVSLTDRDFTIQTYPQVYAYPKRVGVLIEGAASSGDQFAIDARFSGKTVLMGGPSEGVIDYSNVITEAAPSGDFVLAWPMTRSMRLPEEPFDNVGVQPDVPFGPDVEDEISAAQAWLEAQSD